MKFHVYSNSGYLETKPKPLVPTNPLITNSQTRTPKTNEDEEDDVPPPLPPVGVDWGD